MSSKQEKKATEKNSARTGFPRTAHGEAINALAKYPELVLNDPGPSRQGLAESVLDLIIAAVREASSGVIVTFCGNQYAHEAHSWVHGRGTGYQTYRECAGWESNS